MKRNNAVLGLVIGLLFPVFGLVVMYFIWFRGNPVDEVARNLIASHDLTFRVLSLSLIANLLPFSYYNTKRLDNSTRGVLIATILYFVFLVLIKYVWS
jgi:hypothetical protein